MPPHCYASALVPACRSFWTSIWPLHRLDCLFRHGQTPESYEFLLSDQSPKQTRRNQVFRPEEPSWTGDDLRNNGFPARAVFSQIVCGIWGSAHLEGQVKTAGGRLGDFFCFGGSVQPRRMAKPSEVRTGPHRKPPGYEGSVFSPKLTDDFVLVK